MTPIALYWLFLRAALLSFTGFATVPIIHDALVIDHRVLTDSQLNDAIAIGQAAPGPLGTYLVVAGYFVAGIPGALSGALALMTPALLAIPIASIVSRGKSAALGGACSGIIIASCALMLVTGMQLVPQAAPSGLSVALLVVGAVAIAATRITPLSVIAVSAVVGLAAGLMGGL